MAEPKKWPYKNIAITPEVYERVAAIAKIRGISPAKLVRDWAQTCRHTKARPVGRSVISLGGPDNGNAAPTYVVTITLCTQCGQLLVAPMDVYDASQHIAAETVS